MAIHPYNPQVEGRPAFAMADRPLTDLTDRVVELTRKQASLESRRLPFYITGVAIELLVLAVIVKLIATLVFTGGLPLVLAGVLGILIPLSLALPVMVSGVLRHGSEKIEQCKREYSQIKQELQSREANNNVPLIQQVAEEEGAAS